MEGSDDERSSCEGEYTVRNSPLKDAKGEKREDGAAIGAASSFGFSGIDTLSALKLHRSGQSAEKSLRCLHTFWSPGALLQAEPAGGKMSVSRSRRLGRVRRNLGPIGKDLYGRVWDTVHIYFFRKTDLGCIIYFVLIQLFLFAPNGVWLCFDGWSRLLQHAVLLEKPCWLCKTSFPDHWCVSPAQQSGIVSLNPLCSAFSCEEAQRGSQWQWYWHR